MSVTKTCGINRTKFKTPDEAMIYFGIDYTEIRELAHNLGCSTIDALNFALNDTAYESYNILRGTECKFTKHKACGTGAMINRQNQDYINYILHQLRVLGRPLLVDIENGEIKVEDPRAALAVYLVANDYKDEFYSIYLSISRNIQYIKRYHSYVEKELKDMRSVVMGKGYEASLLKKQALSQMERTMIGLWGEFDITGLNKADVKDVIKMYKQSPIFISTGFISTIESAINLNSKAKSIMEQFENN